MMRVVLALAIAASIAVWGYGVWRVATASPVTLPNQVTWLDARGRVLPPPSKTESSPCTTSSRDFALVLGDRLVVPCEVDRHAGWAAIEPAAQTARFAWPVPDGLYEPRVLAIAPRADGRFGIAFEARRSSQWTDAVLAIGVAGRDGWLVPPATIGARDVTAALTDVLALAWTADGSAVEAVVTVPSPGSDNDPTGIAHAPDIVRLAPGAGVTRTRAPIPPCDCTLRGALPGADGWTIVVSSYEERTGNRAVLVSPRGEPRSAPLELAWWTHTNVEESDRLAFGVVNDSFSGQIANLDGTSRPVPESYGDYANEHVFVFGRGGVRRAWITTDRGVAPNYHVMIDGTRHDFGDPEGMPLDKRFAIDGEPVASHFDLHDGFAFVPAVDGGNYLVDPDGRFITLDAELHRTDQQSFVDHLRTRGGRAEGIDEPTHLALLGMFVFGLPLLLGAGWLASHKRGAVPGDVVPVALLRGRTRFVPGPLLATCATWLVVAWWTLSDLLPKL